jgi:hypothetical protein
MIILSDEFESTWKEVVVTYFKLLIHNAPEGSEEDRIVEGLADIRNGNLPNKIRSITAWSNFPFRIILKWI